MPNSKMNSLAGAGDQFVGFPTAFSCSTFNHEQRHKGVGFILLVFLGSDPRNNSPIAKLEALTLLRSMARNIQRLKTDLRLGV
jgi:hypothetical protein